MSNPYAPKSAATHVARSFTVTTSRWIRLFGFRITISRRTNQISY